MDAPRLWFVQSAIWWVLIVLIFIFSLGLWLLRHTVTIDLMQGELTLNYPVAAQGDNQKVYVIDNASRRVVASSNGFYRYHLNGGDRGNTRFYFANALFPLDDGRLVLHNLVMDDNGFYVLREEILLFDSKGRNRKVLWVQNYPERLHKPSLVQRGGIFNIRAVDKKIFWFQLNEQEISYYQKNLDEEKPQKLWSLPFVNASLDIASLALLDKQTVVATLKDGTIRQLSPQGEKILFNGDVNENNQKKEFIVPWKLTKVNDAIIFVDLEGRRLLSLNLLSSDPPQVIMDQAFLQEKFDKNFPVFNYYFVDSNHHHIYTTNDAGVVIIENQEVTFLTSVTYTVYQKLLHVVFYLCLLFLTLTTVVFAIIFYRRVWKSRIPLLVWRGLSIALLVFFVGFVSAALLLPDLSKRYQQVVLDRISQMVQVLPKQLNGDDFHALKAQADYYSPAYQNIRNQLLEAFNFNRDKWNKGYYFALYRVMDNRLYGLMYMNGWINPYYPFDWLQGSENPSVYDQALAGNIATEMIQDVSGEWIYGVGPVYDSQGQVVAIFETGTELFAYRKANEQAIKNLLLQLLTLLVAIVIFLVEMAYLAEVFRQRKLFAQDAAIKDYRGAAVFSRSLSFLFFVSVSLSAAFLSLLSSNLYEEAGVSGVMSWLPGAFLIALPLSVESFAFGLTTFFGGFLVLLLSWRSLLLLGAALSAFGLYLSGLAAHLEALMMGRMLIGVGSGMVYMALRSLINRVQDPKMRSQEYIHFYAGMTAGVNVGLIIGSSAADQVGFSGVFYFGAILSFTVLFLTLFIPYTQTTTASIKENPWQSLQNLQPLFRDKRTWFFFLLLILPTYIAGSFQQYYFPLWGDSNGLTTADVGRLLLIGGLVIIYLGPWLSQMVERYFGNLYGSILGSFLWGAALIFAAFTGNVFGMLLVLMLMGATEGFCVSTQNNLYLNLPVTRKVGADTSVGYFEMFAKLGETLGPLLFALALLLGSLFGMLFLGIVVAILSLLILPVYAGLRSNEPSSN